MKPGFMTKHIVCDECQKIIHLEMPIKGYRAWVAGDNIQTALPELSINERELLISSVCGKCFDILFDIKPGTNLEDVKNKYNKFIEDHLITVHVDTEEFKQ